MGATASCAQKHHLRHDSISSIMSLQNSRADAKHDFSRLLAEKRQQHLSGTREWLLAEVDRLLNENNFLWLTGPPGCGKTVVAAVLLERLGDRGAAWHFCRHDDTAKSEPLAVLSSVASMLCDTLKGFTDVLDADAVEAARASGRPEKVFAALLGKPLERCRPPDKTMVIVFDGVDELSEDGAELLRLLRDFVKCLPNWLRMVVTSREAPDISLKVFAPCCLAVDDRGDLKKYVKQIARRLVKSELSTTDLERDVERKFGVVIKGDLDPLADSIRKQRDLYNAGFVDDDDLLAVPEFSFGVEGSSDGEDSAELEKVLEEHGTVMPSNTLVFTEGAALLTCLEALQASLKLCSLSNRFASPTPVGVRDITLKTQGHAEIIIRLCLASQFAAETGEARPHFEAMISLLPRDATVAEFVVGRLSNSALEVAVEAIVAKAEGLFLYARLLEECYSSLTYDEVFGLPRGLDAMYAVYFKRVQWDKAKLLLAMALAAREPLPIHLATAALGWAEVRDGQDALEGVSLLFPIMDGRLHVTHKSVVDWLANSDHSFAIPDLSAADSTLCDHLIEILGPLIRGEVGADYAEACARDSSLDYALRHVVAHASRAPRPIRVKLKAVLGLRFLAATAAIGRCAALVRHLSAFYGNCEVSDTFKEFRRFVQQNAHVLSATPSSAVYSLAANWPDHTAPRRAFADLLAEAAPETQLVMERQLKPQFLHPGLITLEGHTGSVNSCAFSKDGKRVLTASDDETARLWDSETGALHMTLEGHLNYVTSCAFSKDGSLVVTGSDDKSARVWDAATGLVLKTLSGHDGYVNCCSFSDDGSRIVTGSYDKTSRIWDVVSGDLLQTFQKGHTNGINSSKFSRDGKFIVTGSNDKTAIIWECATGSILKTLTGHSNGVSSCAFSKDGKRVVTGSRDKTCRVWDAKTGVEQLTLKGHASYVNSCSFSTDGKRVITGSYDNAARLWDAETGALQSKLQGHTSYVNSCAFSTDGSRVVTGSDDYTARIWDSAEAPPEKEVSSYVNSVAYSSDGSRVVTGSWDSKARLWDSETGALLRCFEGHLDNVNSCSFSPDGDRIVTGSWDSTARVWDVNKGIVQCTLQGHAAFCFTCCNFSSDGDSIVTGSYDSTGRVWDSRTGELKMSLEGHNDIVWSCAFSHDGKRLVTGSYDKTARLWDAKTGESLKVLEGHGDRVTSCAISRDGERVLTGSQDFSARLWIAEEGVLFVGLYGHTSYVNSCAFSTDGTRAVTGSYDKTVRLWDALTGSTLATYHSMLSIVTSVAVSPKDRDKIVIGTVDGHQFLKCHNPQS